MADIDSKLPVQDAADGTDGASAPVVAQLIGGIDGSSNLQAISTDSAGKVNVTFSNTTLAVTGTFFQATQPISAAALPLPSLASTSTLQTAGNTSVASIDTKTPALGQALAAASVPVVLTAAQLTTLTPLTSVTVTQATGTNLHVVVDSGAVTATPSSSSTATLSNVSGSASSVTLLASNASRKNATFFNDSTSLLYIKFGTTASTTSYTVQVPPGYYYEMPIGQMYTGRIDGIWSAANGAARVTELT